MVAAMLGKPLMEWQQYVADVVLEIDPDTGRLVYDEYDLTVPRQSGKSTFILAKSTHRASASKFFGTRQRLVYTAQTRQKAREKWEEDFVPDLEASRRFKSKITVSRGNGNEHIRFTNGSRFGIEANTEKAGHGGTLDEAYIDEAFAQVDNRLEQAFGPAMITRRNKQLGVVSTAGWLDASPYLLAKVTHGRQLVEQGVTRGTAYFEWSAPEDADPGSVGTWLQCMPALHRPDCLSYCSRHTVTIEAIRAEYEKAVREGKLPDFRRAYLNQWLPKPVATDEDVLPNWGGCVTADPPPRVSVIGLGVSLDLEWASIGAAGERPDGRVNVGAVERRRGTTWLVAEAKRIQDEHDCDVIVDGKCPDASLIPALRDADVRVTVARLNDYIEACSEFVNAVKDGLVTHQRTTELDDAIKAAAWRTVNDRKLWGRKQSAGDISMLEAVTLARWAASSVYDLLDSVY